MLLSGCSGPALVDYAERGPKLVPEQFFSGELTARGVVKDMSGEVQTRHLDQSNHHE